MRTYFFSRKSLETRLTGVSLWTLLPGERPPFSLRKHRLGKYLENESVFLPAERALGTSCDRTAVTLDLDLWTLLVTGEAAIEFEAVQG
ncbi:Hypp5842 [Branchiostoma lanceolatum]|uniref:Hypp5842 protein n=1 Tax=Branchiostoma lanceolatum TaxID=7740 RepID=A0A8J9VKI0_BRALA|nr:Hypp5842 [Branchiostoma lanceolatum]